MLSKTERNIKTRHHSNIAENSNSPMTESDPNDLLLSEKENHRFQKESSEYVSGKYDLTGINKMAGEEPEQTNHSAEHDDFQAESGNYVQEKYGRGNNDEIKKRPGSDMEVVHTPRTKNYFDNMSVISTDKGFDGVNDWESKIAENGETIVKSWPRNNSGIAPVYYGFETVRVEEYEISGKKSPPKEDIETAGFISISNEKRIRREKFNGTEIARKTTISTGGVFGAVLGTGPGIPEAGLIKDPLGDVRKLIGAVKRTGDIKEIEITIIGWEGTDWTHDMKEHYEYDLAAAKTNLQKKFEEEAKGRVKIKMNAYKIERGDKFSTRTIIQLH